MRGRSRSFQAPVHNETPQVHERASQITRIQRDHNGHDAACDARKKCDPDCGQGTQECPNRGEEFHIAGSEAAEGEKRKKERHANHAPDE
jgi:hypothetical protein